MHGECKIIFLLGCLTDFFPGRHIFKAWYLSLRLFEILEIINPFSRVISRHKQQVLPVTMTFYYFPCEASHWIVVLNSVSIKVRKLWYKLWGSSCYILSHRDDSCTCCNLRNMHVVKTDSFQRPKQFLQVSPGLCITSSHSYCGTRQHMQMFTGRLSAIIYGYHRQNTTA